jgi:excinuclease ABC subunit A
MGPEGGKKGGKVVFAGTPEDMIKLENNHTATYLKQVMAK